eukprot:1944218-Prymnesium_polylepis.2
MLSTVAGRRVPHPPRPADRRRPRSRTREPIPNPPSSLIDCPDQRAYSAQRERALNCSCRESSI